MGARARQMDDGSALKTWGQHPHGWIRKPIDDIDFLTGTITGDVIQPIIDASGVYEFTLLSNCNPMPGTVCVHVADGNDTITSITWEIEGFTFDGQPVKETRVLNPRGSGSLTYQTVNPYVWVKAARITQMTSSGDVTDGISLGYQFATNFSNPGGGIMIPFKATSTDEFQVLEMLEDVASGVTANPTIPTPAQAASLSNRIWYPPAVGTNHALYAFIGHPKAV